MRSYRILHVDDDPLMRDIVELALGLDPSFALMSCASGDEALAKAPDWVPGLILCDVVHGFRIACKERPSVIITDNFMPNGDAQYLLYRLCGTPATANIPVFVMSGKPLDELTEHTLRRDIFGHPGAAKIFKKSFDTDELFAALRKFCAFATRPVPD